MTIPSLAIPGSSTSISRLILGCDNKDTMEEGAPLWDHWVSHGGTGFDTAHIYGGGKHETAFGGWLKTRGLADKVTVIVKGAHTPNCVPEAIGKELAISLERLNLKHASIYIMHRDNPDVPVGEFVDALNALQSKGVIGLTGGSNWSVARFQEAATYAKAKNLKPISILNNNMSLAVMEKPVWNGCITSNTKETLAFLRQSGTVHVSWSAQARGYFLPEPLRNRLPEDTRPETCFGSEANAERRRRAETLAAKHGVSANNIALAWVLAQSFPSLALVGPRTIDEINSTLPAASVSLSKQDVSWLNLES